MPLSAPVSTPAPPAQSPAARSAGLLLRRGLERSVALVLVILLYYSWYRYPFRINSTTTSPTYADTPVWLQLGKYLLLSAVLVYAMVARTLSRVPVALGPPLAFLAYAYLTLVPGVVAASLASKDILEASMVFAVPLVLALYAGAELPYRTANRALHIFLYVSLVVEAIQVALFVTVGRLPALAYHGSILVRFGSLLDDPSSYTFLIAWMLPFVGYTYRGVKRVALFAALGICLLLGQSFTGAVAVMAVVALFVVLTAVKHPRSIFKILLGGLALAALVGGVYAAYHRELELLWFAYMRAGKGGSISEHGYALDLLRNTRLMNYLGLEPTRDPMSETAYVNMLATMGVPYVLVYVGVGAAALWRALRILWHPAATREMQAFAASSMGLLTAIYVGCLGLPVSVMYPLNFLGGLTICLLLTFRLPLPAARG